MDSKIIQKYAKYTTQQLVQKAQKAFNSFIRSRDLDGDYFTCISCHVTKHKSQMNAGHYLSAGHHTHIRFNPLNCNGQCIRCNLYLSGNQIGYRIGLVNKIGLHKVIELEQSGRTVHKHDRLHLIEIIEKYKHKK